MRTDSSIFAEANVAASKAPRYVIEAAFDTDYTDLVYITSHADAATPTGATVYEGLIADISGTSQKLNTREGRATIGNITLRLVDRDSAITELLHDKLEAGYGLREKRVRVYLGYEGLAWDDYRLIQTQLVDSVSFDKGAYVWRCADIQRSERKEIFRVAQTNLRETLSEDATTVEVYSTDGFEMLAHGASYSDAPNETVGYIRIGDEIIRYTGTTATSFTGCTRGALNTKAVEHEVNTDTPQDRREEVDEFVYLEMPAPKLAYALLTGNLYNQGGETLPDGWHLNIPAEWVRTSDFTTIGADFWDPDDDAAGYILRFTGLEDEDGKRFIEREILFPMLFSPVYPTGELGLKRLTGVLSDAPHAVELDEGNVVAYQALQHDMREVVNLVEVAWNWSTTKDDYTRRNLLIDEKSIAYHQDAPVETVELRGLHGSRHTLNVLYWIFDTWRDRYAGPPEKVRVSVLPSLNRIEVGDIVRLKLDTLRDAAAGTAIDRAFEVQGVSVDWMTGRVTLDLFGSSQKAGAIQRSTLETVLADSAYAQGTELTAYLDANYPGSYTVTGGVLHITGNCTLTGAADLTAGSAGHYHYLGDVQIDAGVTVTITENVGLWMAGVLTVNGTLTGKGQGIPGTVPVTEGLGWKRVEGTAGFFGSTQAQGQMVHSRPRHEYYSTSAAPITAAERAMLPSFGLFVVDDAVVGLPADLRGTSGGPGGGVTYFSDDIYRCQPGGDGGAGGAGLMTVTRGVAFGANGEIDTSGGDGQPGAYCASDELYSGGGAGGAPGGWLCVLDGSLSVAPDLSHFTATNGATPTQGNLTPTGMMFGWLSPDQVMLPASSGYIGINETTDRRTSAFRTVYLTSPEEPAEDVPEEAEDPLGLTLVEHLDTPHSPGGNLSTIEITVSPPTDGNYSHAMIYSRVPPQAGWAQLGPANDERTVTVASDGTAYEFQARAVSIYGEESPNGPTASITVTDIETAVEEDESLLPVPNVSGLELHGQGNDTEFGGRDAKIAWRKSSVNDYYELGWEPVAGAGGLDQYFKDYEVQVWADNELVRVEYTTDNWYLYTYEKNAEDHKREKGRAGAWREFAFRVYERGRQGQRSERPAKLTVSNPLPGLPTNVTVNAAAVTIFIQGDEPEDLDFHGLMVWLGTATGFTRDVTTLVRKGPGVDTVVDQLADGTKLRAGQTYYLRFASYDAFTAPGQKTPSGLSESAEYAVTMVGVEDDDIVSITADKILAGEILAPLIVGDNITLSDDGSVRSGKAAYGSSAKGFWLGSDSGTPKFDIGDDENYFRFDGDKIRFTGELDLARVNASRIEILSANSNYGRSVAVISGYNVWSGGSTTTTVSTGGFKLPGHPTADIGDEDFIATENGAYVIVSGIVQIRHSRWGMEYQRTLADGSTTSWTHLDDAPIMSIHETDDNNARIFPFSFGIDLWSLASASDRNIDFRLYRIATEGSTPRILSWRISMWYSNL